MHQQSAQCNTGVFRVNNALITTGCTSLADVYFANCVDVVDHIANELSLPICLHIPPSTISQANVQIVTHEVSKVLFWKHFYLYSDMQENVNSCVLNAVVCLWNR